MCGGFVLGDSEAHTLSHSAVSDSLLYLWTQNLVRTRARQWAATSTNSILPSSVRLCKVDRGTLKIAARHIYKDMPLTLRRLMSYIYGAPILDVSRSHTTTQHSR